MIRAAALAATLMLPACTTAQMSSPASRLAIEWLVMQALPTDARCPPYGALPTLSDQIAAVLAERRQQER